MDKALAAKAYLRQQARKATDYFKPTENVRVRDFVREVPGAVGQLFSGTRDTFVKGGKILGEGAAYAIDRNVRDQYKAGNTDILPTISNTTPRQMLASTAKAGLELAPINKIKGLATAAMSARAIPRMAAGGAMGYGYGVADEMSKPGPMNKDTFVGTNPIISLLGGALLGGASRPATEMVGKSLREMGSDLHNMNPMNRVRKQVVGVHDMEPTGIYAAGGIPQMGENPHTYRQEVRTTVDPFNPQSYLARVLMGKQSPMGMTIAGVKPDANGQYPTGSFSARFDKKPRIEIGDEGSSIKDTNLFDIEDRRKVVRNEISPLTTKWWKETATPQELARLDELSVEANNLDRVIHERKKGGMKVGDVFRHDKLFSQYPELKNVNFEVSKVPMLQGTGAFHPEKNRLSIDETVMRNDPEMAKSTMLHELQHAIQTKEGFARGGAPTTNFDDEKHYQTYVKLYNKFRDSGLNQDKASFKAQLETYKRLGGELESRSVQRRMNMTPKERLSSDPYSAEAKATGIKGVDDVITRFDDGVSNSVDSLLQEARKYKTPEDFVKAQGSPVYHGTGEGVNFESFDVSKAQIGNRGKQIYLTENQAAADWFSKLKSQTNFMQSNAFLKGNATAEIGKFKPNVKEFIIPKNAKIKVLDALPQYDAEIVINQLKKEGYDGVRFTDDVLNTIEGQPELAKAFVNGKHPDTTIMFSPEKLLTKSQLTDLWKKAHNKK